MEKVLHTCGVRGGGYKPHPYFLASNYSTVYLFECCVTFFGACLVCEFGYFIDEFVTVGWGKKETQFQGQIGKQAAFEKKETPDSTLSFDTKRSLISWRGDGEFFAVSAVNPRTGCREIRTWSRAGIHSSTCESIVDLEPSLDWRFLKLYFLNQTFLFKL